MLMVQTTAHVVRDNVARIREQIASTCRQVGRDPSEVRLVAASKTVAAEAIGWARAAGVSDFGENYVQELRDKREAAPDATWHFIGTLQSHTAHHVADLADVVQTLTPGRAATRLARRAARQGRRLLGLIEVDFTGGRSGASPDRAEAFAVEVAEMPGVEVVGLMTLPPIPERAEDSRPFFRSLRQLRDRMVQGLPDLRELSMGMSMDFPVAIEEGATMVRIGTALFGERPPTT